MKPLHRLLVALLATLASAVVLAIAAAPASAQASSLVGETLVATNVEVVARCSPSETSTFTFRAEGLAVGPYSGTFVEEGTVTTTSGAGSTALSFESTFTIFALTGEPLVTGRKTLLEPVVAYCVEPLGVGFEGNVAYEATITTASGTFRDTGVAFADLVAVFCDPECEAGFFSEDFLVSSGVLPVFTSGKATGGGQFLRTTTQEHITFGFEVKSSDDRNRLQGRCLVLDKASNTRIKCLNVSDYEEIANTATWEGDAEVNGVIERYRITVQDNGEPNQGLDTFAIDTVSYHAAGPVVRGNVQLHKQQGLP